MHNLCQMVVKRENFSSVPMLNKEIKGCLGWDERASCGSCCFLQEVEDEGLHIFLVMVGYFMKDNGHEHFEFVHRIVSAEDMNEGKLEYVKFGKVGLNKRVSPPHINILQRMHQWARLCM